MIVFFFVSVRHHFCWVGARVFWFLHTISVGMKLELCWMYGSDQKAKRQQPVTHFLTLNISTPFQHTVLWRSPVLEWPQNEWKIYISIYWLLLWPSIEKRAQTHSGRAQSAGRYICALCIMSFRSSSSFVAVRTSNGEVRIRRAHASWFVIKLRIICFAVCVLCMFSHNSKVCGSLMSERHRTNWYPFNLRAIATEISED